MIDKSREDWATAAQRHAPQGFRAIFDANGVSTLKASYELLASWDLNVFQCLSFMLRKWTLGSVASSET